MKDKIYLCKYSEGSYEDLVTINVFAVEHLRTAENWVLRFNERLAHWKKYYSQFSDTKWGIENVSDEYLHTKADRYWQIMNINKAFIETIELKK